MRFFVVTTEGNSSLTQLSVLCACDSSLSKREIRKAFENPSVKIFFVESKTKLISNTTYQSTFGEVHVKATLFVAQISGIE